MPLPSSGPLSILDIVNQLSSQFDIVPPYGLRNLSSLAGFSTPDSISEFYGYGAVLSYSFSISGSAGSSGSMNVYRNKILMISVSSNSSGTISASSGDNFDVEVYANGFAGMSSIARIYYPAVYAVPQAQGTGRGYAAASYSFTYDGSSATITGTAYNSF